MEESVIHQLLVQGPGLIRQWQYLAQVLVKRSSELVLLTKFLVDCEQANHSQKLVKIC